MEHKVRPVSQDLPWEGSTLPARLRGGLHPFVLEKCRTIPVAVGDRMGYRPTLFLIRVEWYSPVRVEGGYTLYMHVEKHSKRRDISLMPAHPSFLDSSHVVQVTLVCPLVRMTNVRISRKPVSGAEEKVVGMTRHT